MIRKEWPNDFDELWALLGKDGMLGEVEIDWTGEPNFGDLSSLNLGWVLSPVAWGVSAVRAGIASQINIIDKRTGTYIPAPWERALAALGDASPVRLLDDAATPRVLPSSAPAEIVDLFVSRLREELLSTDAGAARHALANLLGPILLGFGRPDRFRTALRHLVEALGIINKSQPGQRPRVSHLGELSPREGTADQPIWLVDDNANEGWAEFVESRCGKGITIQTGPKTLEAAIEHVINQNGYDVGPHLEADLVFLDLRFYHGADIGDEEKTLFEDLLSYAEALNERPHGWPRISEGDLKEIYGWLNSTRHDDARRDERYPVVLSLLPRLLAQADPTLPIVLFSSTTQREVTDRFSGFGTIITSFRKPVLHGYRKGGFDEDTEAALQRALREAARLVRARRFIRELTNSVVSAAEERNRSIVQLSRAGERRHSYVEVYIDESGRSEDPIFCVGGMALFFPSRDSATQFHESLTKTGLAIGWDRDFINRRNGKAVANGSLLPDIRLAPQYARLSKWLGKRPNDKDLDAAFSRFDALLTAGEIGKVCFAVFRPQRIEAKPEVLLDPNSLDNLYLKIVKDLLEILLFDLIPGRLDLSATCEVAVYVATRQVDRPADDELWRDWKDSFDVQSNPTDTKMYVVSEGDVYKIVREVLARRSDLKALIPKIARAAMLKDFEGTDDLYRNSRDPAKILYNLDRSLPRQGHYFADLVVNRARDRAARAKWSTDDWASSWFSGGLALISDETWDEVVAASRHAAYARAAEALAALYGVRLSRWSPLVNGVSSVTKNLGGLEFARLADLLASKPVVAESRIKSQVRIRGYGSNVSLEFARDGIRRLGRDVVFRVIGMRPEGRGQTAVVEFDQESDAVWAIRALKAASPALDAQWNTTPTRLY